MSPAEQLAAIKAKSFSMANTTVEQTQGGFIVTGTINWFDNDTRVHVHSQSDREVAIDADHAFTLGHRYATTGSFVASKPGMPQSSDAVMNVHELGGVTI